MQSSFASFEMAISCLRQVEEETHTRYVCVQQRKCAQKIENKRIFWQEPKQSFQGIGIKFDGVPFIVNGIHRFHCYQGKQRYCKKTAENSEPVDRAHKRRRFLVQNSIKKNCPVVVVIREITRFPQFAISADTLKRRRKSAKKLRTSLCGELSSNVVEEKLYIVNIPTIDQHCNHIVGEAAALQLPVHSKVKDFIRKQVDDGVFSVAEMKRHTEAFVKTVLFNGKRMPSSLNRRYFPLNRDYSNIIYRSRMKKAHSVIDEENLIEKIHHWNISNPDDYFYFRYCSAPGQRASPHVDDEVADVEMQSTKNGLLLVYQSVWQRKLLSKYGSVCLLDATYKTTKYAVPLFFLCVKTNVDYCVAATFVTQFEDASSIAEALQLINQWNPEWKPESFVVDYCEAEITALEKVFPGCEVNLCDFHREQAWERWATKHGASDAAVKDELLARLRHIAAAPNIAAYHAAVSELKGSTVWSSNIALQRWFAKTWLREHKRWVQAFRSSKFHVRITTNKGVERQNRALKHEYLVAYRDKTLSGLMTVLVERFFPDAFRKYVQLNNQFNDAYRSYNADLPAFLINRPRDFVQHVCQRWTSADLFEPRHINQIDERTWSVTSIDSEKTYSVHFGNNRIMPCCSCHDWERYHWPCKHFCAVFRSTEFGWESLCSSYRDSPYFKLDSDAVTLSLSIPTVPDYSDEITVEPGDTVDSIDTRAAECRRLLKNMIDLTYRCTSIQHFEDLRSTLHTAQASFTGGVPHDHGQL